MPSVSPGFQSNTPVAAAAARHPEVVTLFREWKNNHEDKRAFVQKVEIIDYQRTLKVFIEKAEKAVGAIKGQTLGSTRFRDSIAALEQLIRHAREKLAFLFAHSGTIGYESSTFGKAMTFDEQRMVPQFSDFGNITAKIAQLKTQDAAMPQLTESQAWALVAANMKGNLNESANRELAIERLQKLNAIWKTSYTTDDLKQTYRYMVERTRLATQYRLEKPPGQQQGINSGGTPLYKLLMQSGFKNMWETGTSQASNNRGERGAIEEQMGYSAALRRTAGRPQGFTDRTGAFDPKDAAEMPRYGATISAGQESGVGFRYGSSYIVWKESVRQRVTWTPGDSWNMGAVGPQSVKNFVSLNHPEVIFAHADETVLRIFMAEATGKDTKFLSEVKHEKVARASAYVETQIHGGLTWKDVEEVVLDSMLPNVDKILSDFEEFKKKNPSFNFNVRTTDAYTRPRLNAVSLQRKPS